MEIVAVETVWTWYIATVALLIVATIGIWTVASMLAYTGEWLTAALAAVYGIAITVLTIGVYLEGPDVTYTARVYDVDDVYARGYEIVGQNGKLFEIKEAD